MAGLWSVALRAAMRAFESLGIDTLEVCRRSDIDPKLLDDPDARIPLELTARIWPHARQLWGKRGVGLHAGCALKFGSLDVLDYAFATAPTVGQGLANIARYYDVVTNGVTQIRVVEDGADVRVQWLPVPIDDLRDYGIACIVERLKYAHATPSSIELRGEPCVPVREYARCLGCAVSFGHATNVVHVRGDDARRAPPTTLPGLRDVIDREIGRVRSAAARSRDPLHDVRKEVVAAFGRGTPALRDIARALSLSERTLQRRLADSQTTFRDVVEGARREVALAHLEGDRLSVAEVAFLLGYSEPSAFSRAFRRWTGEWPIEYRARRRGRTSRR